MRQPLTLKKRQREWVVARSNSRIIYASGCYAKAAGVHEFLENGSKAQARETKWQRRQFRASRTASLPHSKPAKET